MTPLEKMIESCGVFARNPKVGNIEFETNFTEKEDLFSTKIGEFEILISCSNAGFYFYLNANPSVKLKATTAQEAATEALELCRKEAQKLVELLGEPKEQNYTKEFLEWKSKYFDRCDNVVLEWEDKKEKMKYSTKELIFIYEKAFKEKAFLNKTK